jgi:hypothetical protein
MTLRNARRAFAAAAVTGAAALSLVAAQAQPAPAATAAVPAHFKAAAISFRSAQHGWLLGSAPCGRKSCTDVLSTSNGGGSWHLAGSIAAPIATNQTPPDVGVDGVQFATASVGWAYQPGLLRTANGGRTWRAMPVPGHGHQILALASSSAATYAVVSPCREFTICTSKLTLWKTASLTATSWTKLKLSLPVSDAASLATLGPAVYVLQPGVPGWLYFSATGRSFAARPTPCSKARELGLVQVVPTSAKDLTLLCDGNGGFYKAIKTVFRSVNTGRTDTSAGTTPLLGTGADLAASPAGNLVVGAWSSGTFLYLNDSHQATWSTPLRRMDGGAGLNGLAFTTSKVAWAVYGPVTFFAGNLGSVLVTRDGGQHWAKATL